MVTNEFQVGAFIFSSLMSYFSHLDEKDARLPREGAELAVLHFQELTKLLHCYQISSKMLLNIYIYDIHLAMLICYLSYLVINCQNTGLVL